ncbi:MAG TPA: VOC family protein [Acidimicrobiales bacterium]|nr:VOC family protein [Acidimicrobiales bacterium]
MSVVRIAVVVPSTNHDAAVARYKDLLGADIVAQFELPGGSLTVTVLPGISVLSGNEQYLAPARDLRATLMVDSLPRTRELLERTGWLMQGTLGAPGSLLARDPDGTLFEFVESPT